MFGTEIDQSFWSLCILLKNLHAKINDNDIAVWVASAVQDVLGSMLLAVGSTNVKPKTDILEIPMNYIMMVEILDGVEYRPTE